VRSSFLFLFITLFGLQYAFAQSSGCQLTDLERQLVEDATENFVLDALFTAGSGVNPDGFPAKVHFGYASTLLGQIPFQGQRSDVGIRESASLTELCTGPKTFAPTCRSQNTEPAEDRFWKEHDVCVEISCEAKGIYKADIQWSSLQIENTRFSYNAAKKQEIIYDPAPSVVWRLNDKVSGRLIVTGELLSSARVKQRDGKAVRAIYTGNVTAITTHDDGLFSLVLNMTFPGLGGLTPVRAELLLHRHDASSANGSIQRGDNTLANLTLLPGQPLKIEWTASCP
jgi:hypothetical protein